MITVKSSLTVKLEFDGGHAEFVFKYPRVNKVRRFSTEEDPFVRAEVVLGELISLSGLVDDTGAPVTVEQAKEMDLPVNLLWALVAAYTSAAVNELRGPEAEPKNETSASA